MCLSLRPSPDGTFQGSCYSFWLVGVTDVAFFQGISGGFDRKLILFDFGKCSSEMIDVDTMLVTTGIPAHPGFNLPFVYSVCWNPMNLSQCAVGLGDGTVCLVDVESTMKLKKRATSAINHHLGPVVVV